jgi:iron(III) transport system permease protein
VLGLGYIFFFNARANPLHFIYATMAILVVCTSAHFYSVAHLTAVTALKQIDNEFETVAASLRVPVWRTFFRVTVPVSLPAIFDIALYLFVNAMTTVSAVVFLYSPDTTLAAIAVLNMDDAGDIAPAAAMATLILATSVLICGAYALVTRRVLFSAQAWRRR